MTVELKGPSHTKGLQKATGGVCICQSCLGERVQDRPCVCGSGRVEERHQQC